jgi:hypothetical protein
MGSKLYPFIAFAAVVLLVYTGGYYEGRSDENADWVAQQAQQEKDTKEKAGQLEKTYTDKIAEVEKNAESTIKGLQADLARANAAYDSLHDAAGVYADGVDKCPTSSGASSNRSSCTLLAHLFKEADTRSGALADTADKAIIAAETCKAAYNTLRK